MKCSECGQILAADIVTCTNCGTPVNATLVYREVDEPIVALPAPPSPHAIDLTELDIVDLRELVTQLDDELAERMLEPANVAPVRNTEAIRRQWAVQSRNSAVLWPQRDQPRPTIDDITPRG